MQEKSTINLKEVAKFGQYAKNWWNESADEVKMLHKMNPIRIEYILKQTPLKGLKVLDVGCGGGILTIPLARIGANIFGLEPARESCEIAVNQAQEEGLNVNFTNSSIEDCTESEFDVILLMDVIEHVANVELFLENVASKLKQGGLIIISTINNTLLSKIFVKFFAEDVLRIIPKGTHEAENFISPERIEKILANFKRLDVSGFSYNPIFGNFKLTKSHQMNYFLTLKK
jgi:2-polyprenyl-6-hydroxyphenyl methylase/3-demethylubiquinone-9 3-methyltransferase